MIIGADGKIVNQASQDEIAKNEFIAKVQSQSNNPSQSPMVMHNQPAPTQVAPQPVQNPTNPVSPPSVPERNTGNFSEKYKRRLENNDNKGKEVVQVMEQ